MCVCAQLAQWHPSTHMHPERSSSRTKQSVAGAAQSKLHCAPPPSLMRQSFLFSHGLPTVDVYGTFFRVHAFLCKSGLRKYATDMVQDEISGPELQTLKCACTLARISTTTCWQLHAARQNPHVQDRGPADGLAVFGRRLHRLHGGLFAPLAFNYCVVLHSLVVDNITYL